MDQKLPGDFVNQSNAQTIQVYCWISDLDKDLKCHNLTTFVLTRHHRRYSDFVYPFLCNWMIFMIYEAKVNSSMKARKDI